MSQINETSTKVLGQTQGQPKSVAEKDETYNIQESSIKIARQTRDRFKTFGKWGETYDAMLNRLMDEVAKR